MDIIKNNLGTALLVLIAAGGVGILGVIYFAVVLGLWDMVAGGPKFVPGLPASSLAERAAVFGMSLGVPCGAVLGLAVADRTLEIGLPSNWWNAAIGFVPVAIIVLLAVYYYFFIAQAGLIGSYGTVGVFVGMGFVGCVYWLMNMIDARR